MPNWCNNSLSISGDKTKIKEIHDKLESIKNNKDNVHGIFRVLLGEPTDITEEQYQKGGWYEHNINRYGCKWDVSYDEDTMIDVSENNIAMSFQTAWSPCLPFCITLSEMFGVDVTCQFFEPGCDFAGEVVISNGEIITVSEYSHNEGMYHLDIDGFWHDMEFNLTYELEENPNKTVDELFAEYKYLKESDKDEFIESYNNAKESINENK